MREKTAAPAGGGVATSRTRALMRWIVHVLYVILNTACMIVYAYQIYLWLRQGAWKRIPSGLVLHPGTVHHFSAQAGGMGKVVAWMLNVELAYSLCVVAMLFYGIRWWIDRQVQTKPAAVPGQP